MCSGLNDIITNEREETVGRKAKKPDELSVNFSVTLDPEYVRKLARLMSDRQQGRSDTVRSAIDCLYAQQYPTETNSNPTEDKPQ
jgi:glycyl-tRNA synthetase (class II)